MTDTPEQPPAATDPEVLRSVAAMSAGTLVERMRIEFLEASPDRMVARMPVAGNTQPYGLLHGGASAVLAETLGSVAAALHAGPDRVAVGLDINATHHRGPRSGHVTGTAVALTRGNTVACYEVAIVDEQGARVCTARLTCLIRGTDPAA